MSIPQLVVEEVTTRADGWCEACEGLLVSGSLIEGGAFHHRLLRSAGGPDTAVNLMLVHHGCHTSIHSRVARSRRLHHILDRGTDPETAPVPTVVRGLRRIAY